MSETLISLIVPAYNAAAYLPEFCESVVAQTHGDFEVLIGDDGSTDKTREVLAPFLRDPRFRYFSWQPNRGVHHGTVFLFQQARGSFWCSPGADDVLLPQFLEKRLALLRARPEASMVHGPAYLIDGVGAPVQNDETERIWPLLTERMPSAMPATRALRLLLQHNLINIPSALVRMDVTRLILPFFAPHWWWALDWALWILLAATGFDFLWDREQLHRYRIHASSNTLTASPEKQRLRQIERKLVPLCSLHSASLFSPLAKTVWLEQRLALYRWWLTTAGTLWMKGAAPREAHAMAATALRGAPGGPAEALADFLWHGPNAAWQRVRERHAHRHQLFQVSGLSLIDDPLLRRS